MKQPIFKASHIVKQFGPTIALNDVDIEIFAGEIRGFIGENGSGKSTMSALMTGIHQKTSGTMWYHDKVWEPSSMIEALNGGIGIIVQENGTISEISVAENIFLGELKQFAGVNYFESRKIEDFSPLFDLDISALENIKKEYVALFAEKSKSESKKLLKQAKKALLAEYKKLNEKLLADNATKKSQIVAEFDNLAEKAFNDFNQQLAAINQKYAENADGLDEVIKQRRLKNDIGEAKRAYKRLIKGMKNKTYMKLDWVAKDVQSLKNCYLNNCQDLEVIVENKVIRSIKNFIQEEGIDNGIIYSCEKCGVPYVLGGSIRDDGPLPPVYADVYAAQDAMRNQLRTATTVICMATMLHTIAVGNMTPSYRVTADGTVRQVYFYCVDVSEFAVNKLADRGSLSARGIVTNVQDFAVLLQKGLNLSPDK